MPSLFPSLAASPTIHFQLLHLTNTTAKTVYSSLLTVWRTYSYKLIIWLVQNNNSNSNNKLVCLATYNYAVLLDCCFPSAVPSGMRKHSHVQAIYHSVTRQCHCCKGDAASQWEMAILGVSELRNPWTDRLKIWHTWLRWWGLLVVSYAKFHKNWQNKDWPAIWWNVHLAYFFNIFTGDFLGSSTEKILNNFKRLMA